MLNLNQDDKELELAHPSDKAIIVATNEISPATHKAQLPQFC